MLENTMVIGMFGTKITRSGAGRRLLEGFRLQAQIPLTRSLLFPVLADPSLPALSGGRVPAGESKCRYIGVVNFQSLVRIFEQDSHKTSRQGWTIRPFEQIAFNF